MKFTVVNESLYIYKPNVLYWELFNYFNVLLTEWEIYKNDILSFIKVYTNYGVGMMQGGGGPSTYSDICYSIHKG